jgi:hypothetical protein
MDSRDNYSSETKALQGVAKDLGVAAESLRRWRVCITMSSCAGKSPDLSSGSACFVQGWRLLSSLVVFGYFMSECVLR